METYLAEILFFAFDFVPRGFLPCDGRVIPVEGNLPLSCLVGNRTGSGSFQFPDLLSLAPSRMGYCICVFGSFPYRK